MSRTKINLLPWREEKRKKQKQDFLGLLLLAALLGGLAWWLWLMAVQTSVDHQNERNRQVQTSMAKLDQRIKEIEDVDQIGRASCRERGWKGVRSGAYKASAT